MEWERRVREIAQGAVCREKILSLLKVAACNLGLGCSNVLLVYSQAPDARFVCGRSAWKGIGRTVWEGANGIMLMLPKICLVEGRYTLSYLAVRAYGVEETSGREIPAEPQCPSFADRITQKTGATWEIVNAEGLQGSVGKGYYDAEQHVFYLAKSCKGEQVARECLSLYVDYCIRQEGEADRLLRLAVSYVLFDHFQIKHTVVGALFNKLAELPVEDRIFFVRRVCKMVEKILADLEGCVLNFNETAILNDLLVTGEKDGICRILGQAGKDLAGTAAELEILELGEKLSRTRPECIKRLYGLRAERKLFSYPPVALETEQGEVEGWQLRNSNKERSSYGRN